MAYDGKYFKRCFLIEERRIDIYILIKILLRTLKIDSPCEIMAVMKANAI